MNETEERRRELLKQARRMYDEDRFIPAVHPRYQNLYQDLYDPEERVPNSSFFLRFTLCVILFACYVWMDYSKIPVANVNSEQIVVQIEKQIDLEKIGYDP